MGVPNFSIFFHSLCGPIWMIFGGPATQHGELFPHRRTFFYLAEKSSEFTTEISFCEFGFFFLPKKKSFGGKGSSQCRVSGPPKTIQIAPHRERQKKRVSLVCFCLYRGGTSEKRHFFLLLPFCTFFYARGHNSTKAGDLNERNLGLKRPGCLGTNQLRVLRADLGV